MPKADSSSSLRPLIIFVHGGGFSSGSRDHSSVVSWCEHWAQCGYVVASISYRLTLKGKSFHCDLPSEEKVLTFQNATLDLHAATALLLKKYDQYGIDKDKVIIAGSSAGAETVLHAAFWRKADLPGNSSLLPEEFSFAGIISYAGAIVDTLLITAENQLPMALFHGSCDPLVPYETAAHHYCPENTPGALPLAGGADIAARLKTLGSSYLLHTTCNGGHEVCGTAMKDHLAPVTRFLFEAVLEDKRVQSSTFVTSPKACNLPGVENYCDK